LIQIPGHLRFFGFADVVQYFFLENLVCIAVSATANNTAVLGLDPVAIYKAQILAQDANPALEP
jgi:hypothetical protein